MLNRPRNLEISNAESTEDTSKIDQGTNFTLVFREGVVTVCVDGDSVDHDGELGDTPAHDESADAEMLLE